jgi:hypothetical protein
MLTSDPPGDREVVDHQHIAATDISDDLQHLRSVSE